MPIDGTATFIHWQGSELDNPMHSSPRQFASSLDCEFDALLRQLDTPSLAGDVTGGYAVLMARIGSVEFRRRCGLFSH